MEVVVILAPLVWAVCLGKCDTLFYLGNSYFFAYKREKYVYFEKALSENNNTEENNVLSKALFNIIIGAVGVILFLFALDVFLVNRHESIAGIFGDFFGGVLNPILTFLTFIGLIVTIVIQRNDLRLSRVEYEKTAEALTTQSVENTFFNILDLHHKIAENIKFDLSVLGGNAYLEKVSKMKKYFRSDGRPLGVVGGLSFSDSDKASAVAAVTKFEGRAAFDEILKHLTSGSATPKQIMDRYKKIQVEHNYIIGHYFRNLYQVLKMIDKYDDSIVSVEYKFKYASILRAQLSTNELALLFLNCLDNVCDKGQFKNYIIKYEMFEHLTCRELESEGRFQLGGSAGITVDRSMLLQYKRIKEFKLLDLEKVYGGAFGSNRGVPYDLSRRA
jgi:hypothetical protein